MLLSVYVTEYLLYHVFISHATDYLLFKSYVSLTIISKLLWEEEEAILQLSYEAKITIWRVLGGAELIILWFFLTESYRIF